MFPNLEKCNEFLNTCPLSLNNDLIMNEFISPIPNSFSPAIILKQIPDVSYIILSKYFRT